MRAANDYPVIRKMYEKVIYSSDWKSKAGYEPSVASSSEQEEDDVKTIQKFGYVIAQNPNNPALKRIAQSRQLKLLDLNPAELKEIEDAEDQMVDQVLVEAIAQLRTQAETPVSDPSV